jgi:acyl carrier protein phosphodiesterase
MNYLAHAYLSFNKPEILAGNMISDFVKGKKKFEYPAGIQEGIQLHREIDNFTDRHPATHSAKEVFRANYRLYAGAFMDIVYDHFLAIDKKEFPGDTLLSFSEDTYALLEPFILILPENFQRMFPYMRQQNWLFNYQYPEGIKNSMAGLVRRSTWLTESATAFALFKQHYSHLQLCYSQFFPELKEFVKQQLRAV